MWPQLRSFLTSKTHLILWIWSAQQRALRPNETSPVSMTVFFGSSLEASIFSTSLWKEGPLSDPRPGSFPRCLKNPTIDSSVVGFNANSNLFWAHSDQHLGNIHILKELWYFLDCVERGFACRPYKSCKTRSGKFGAPRAVERCWKQLFRKVADLQKQNEILGRFLRELVM